jgi:hypothetical protein
MGVAARPPSSGKPPELPAQSPFAPEMTGGGIIPDGQLIFGLPDLCYTFTYNYWGPCASRGSSTRTRNLWQCVTKSGYFCRNRGTICTILGVYPC